MMHGRSWAGVEDVSTMPGKVTYNGVRRMMMHALRCRRTKFREMIAPANPALVRWAVIALSVAVIVSVRLPCGL